MRTIVRAARVLTPDEEISPGAALIEDGVITAVGSDIPAPANTEVLDLPEATLVPGFIDLHVHGGGGYSLATHDAHEIESYARWVTAHGVTSFLATIFAPELEEALDFVRVAAHAVGNTAGGANLLGLNMEGPFVNPDRRGALPKTWPLPPDPRTFDGIAQAAEGRIRLMTVSPEIVGTGQLIRAALSRGVAVSIGHTDADYDAALRAFQNGASHVTHAFNAMRPFHHRDPGVVGAAIDSEGVSVEVIADGVHLHPATVAMLIRALGPGRVALVTDAVPPAGLAAGEFRIGQERAWLEAGRITLPSGTIAGSAATMDELIRNVALEWGLVDLAAAVRMASTVPARVLGLEASKGRIAAGFDADIVALDRDLNVVLTIAGGEAVYRRGGA